MCLLSIRIYAGKQSGQSDTCFVGLDVAVRRSDLQSHHVFGFLLGASSSLSTAAGLMSPDESLRALAIDFFWWLALTDQATAKS